MQFIFLPKSSVSCAVASAPIVYDSKTTIAAASGSTAIPVVSLASGARAYYGGIVANPGCKPIRLNITYLTGADCNVCNDPDTLSTTVLTVVVPGGSSKTIPDGYWSVLTIQSLDAATETTPTDVTVAQDVWVSMQHNSGCADCNILVP